MVLITSSFDSFKKVSRWTSLSQYFDKPLREKCGYGKLLKKHFDGQTYFRFLSQTFVFSETGYLFLRTCVKESHFGKTCICREIKFLIVFSISCVCFKEIFTVTYGECVLPTYPEWNIREGWKFKILWASYNTKPF